MIYKRANQARKLAKLSSLIPQPGKTRESNGTETQVDLESEEKEKKSTCDVDKQKTPLLRSTRKRSLSTSGKNVRVIALNVLTFHRRFLQIGRPRPGLSRTAAMMHLPSPTLFQTSPRAPSGETCNTWIKLGGVFLPAKIPKAVFKTLV